MIIFREPTRLVTRLPAVDDLIGWGEIDAAVMDECCPDADDLVTVPPPKLPITVSIPEGYAYYGLDPVSYAKSAERFGSDIAGPVVCIGIRSIGSSLSRVVAGTLSAIGIEVHRYTVRPRGHPANRQLKIGSRLEQAWRSLSHATFAIIDEGPGLSGSTLACVAKKVTSLGVPACRIVLFPSYIPDDAKYPRLQPYRKYWTSITPKPGWKWAGLSVYGEERLARAQQLANAGFSPAALELRDGYMKSEFVPGRQVSAAGRDPELFKTMARYLAFRKHAFRSDTATPVDQFAHIVEHNSGLGITPPSIDSPVITDARMRPDKWIWTSRGYLKLDAVDHGDGHYYPGPTDIAWDIAGVVSEFYLNRSEAGTFVELYIRYSADRHVKARLPFFQAAYRAFWHGFRSTYDH
jgi:hypothetical protein